jgi:hypothetical protein
MELNRQAPRLAAALGMVGNASRSRHGWLALGYAFVSIRFIVVGRR